MTENKKNIELKVGDYIAINNYTTSNEPAIIENIEEVESELKITYTKLSGETNNFYTDKEDETQIYKFKKGEKTIVKRILSKMKKEREKLEVLENKFREEQYKLRTLENEYMAEYKEFSKAQKVFEKLPVENLLRKHNVQLKLKGTNPNKLSMFIQEETQKYLREDDYPFLYLEYDLNMMINDDIFEETVNINLSKPIMERIEKIASEHKMIVKTKKYGDVGDKNSVTFGLEIEFEFKNKFNWDKFEKFVEALSEIEFTEENLKRYLSVKISRK